MHSGSHPASAATTPQNRLGALSCWELRGTQEEPSLAPAWGMLPAFVHCDFYEGPNFFMCEFASLLSGAHGGCVHLRKGAHSDQEATNIILNTRRLSLC